jgi:hypothetical protein
MVLGLPVEADPRPAFVEFPTWRFVTARRASQVDPVLIVVQQRVVSMEAAERVLHAFPHARKRAARGFDRRGPDSLRHDLLGVIGDHRLASPVA